jgi:hypothetical protein
LDRFNLNLNSRKSVSNPAITDKKIAQIMVCFPQEQSTCHLRGGKGVATTSCKPSPPLSNFPAESKSSQQWQAKIRRIEDRGEAERKAKQARRNRRDDGAERRAFQANGRRVWEI